MSRKSAGSEFAGPSITHWWPNDRLHVRNEEDRKEEKLKEKGGGWESETGLQEEDGYRQFRRFPVNWYLLSPSYFDHLLIPFSSIVYWSFGSTVTTCFTARSSASVWAFVYPRKTQFFLGLQRRLGPGFFPLYMYLIGRKKKNSFWRHVVPWCMHLLEIPLY